VSQFQVDGQSVHFGVLVEHGQNVFGSDPSVVTTFGDVISGRNVGGRNVKAPFCKGISYHFSSHSSCKKRYQ
jgi:hypothetical protein